MNRLTRVAVAAVGALLLTFAAPALPAGSATTAPVGYTTIRGEAGCDLATVDLGSGLLTDLPAAANPFACVADLAMAPDGTVWGLYGIAAAVPVGNAPAAPASQVLLVRFAADGTPATTPVLPDEAGYQLGLQRGGLAVTSGGLVFAQMTAYGMGLPGATPAAATLADCTSTVCLFTIDPTTGIATPVGPSTLLSSSFDDLTVCDDSMWTQGFPDGAAMQPVDPATGAVGDPGDYLDRYIVGYDCPSNDGVLYAIAAPPPVAQAVPQAATGPAVGTLNPATGVFTQNALVSDPTVDLEALAVPITTTPPPTVPTTAPPSTTTPSAAQPATVTPRFTG